MMLPFSWVTTVALALLWPMAAGSAEAVNVASADTGAFSGSFYRVRPDLRKCASPFCGGYWISLVNRKSTVCIDGEARSECYVAAINWDNIVSGSPESSTLVRGEQRRVEFPGAGQFGTLIAEQAWRPATSAAAEGMWYGLHNTDIQCITYPCFNIKERMLNRQETELLSGIDLSGVKATDADVESAYDALSSEGLIAVGRNQVVPNEGPAGDGLRLSATQFFLPVGTSDRFCRQNSDCTASPYRQFVKSPEQCYCPLCPEPMNVTAAERNEQSWTQNCGDFGYSSTGGDIGLVCPMVFCIAQPPVACVDHRCVYQQEQQ